MVVCPHWMGKWLSEASLEIAWHYSSSSCTDRIILEVKEMLLELEETTIDVVDDVKEDDRR